MGSAFWALSVSQHVSGHVVSNGCLKTGEKAMHDPVFLRDTGSTITDSSPDWLIGCARLLKWHNPILPALNSVAGGSYLDYQQLASWRHLVAGVGADHKILLQHY